MARKPRNPKWYESNLMAKEGIRDTENWKVVRSNQEYLLIQNRKTGAVRELARGGKIKLRRADRVDLSVGLAREMRSRREARG